MLVYVLNKGGVRKNNQASYLIKGFRLWDKVLYNSEECFVQDRKSSGYFQLNRLDGTLISASMSCKKLKLVETAKHYITERRAVSSPWLKPGVSTADI